MIDLQKYCDTAPGLIEWVEQANIQQDQINRINFNAELERRQPKDNENPKWKYWRHTGNYTVTLIMANYYHKQKIFTHTELFGEVAS